MTLDEFIAAEMSENDGNVLRDLVRLLDNSEALFAELRLPADAWSEMATALQAIPGTPDRDTVDRSIRGVFEKWKQKGPLGDPNPRFLERVTKVRKAIKATRTAGITRKQTAAITEKFERLFAAFDLNGLRSVFHDIPLGWGIVWATPFEDLAKRPFDGLTITELIDRLALGRAPDLDGDDWVLAYEPPPSLECKVPTMGDACDDRGWHLPFFPAPMGSSYGITKPSTAGLAPFFEVVHGRATWQSLASLPDNRRVAP